MGDKRTPNPYRSDGHCNNLCFKPSVIEFRTCMVKLAPRGRVPATNYPSSVHSFLTMIQKRTLSLESCITAWLTASADPWTSALMTRVRSRRSSPPPSPPPAASAAASASASRAAIFAAAAPILASLKSSARAVRALLMRWARSSLTTCCRHQRGNDLIIFVVEQIEDAYPTQNEVTNLFLRLL